MAKRGHAHRLHELSKSAQQVRKRSLIRDSFGLQLEVLRITNYELRIAVVVVDVALLPSHCVFKALL